MERPQLVPLPEDFDRVLVVVAHPDDIEYGLNAAVARWTDAGKDVSYYLATRGEAGIDTMHPEEAGPVREQEQRAASAAVGVTAVDFGDHPDGVVEYSLALRRDIARQIRRHRPDLVVVGPHEAFAGGRPNQADHRAVGLAAIDAVADAGNRWIFPELVAEGAEPWHVPRLALVGSSVPTHFVDVTGSLDRAVKSLEEHRSYNEALPVDFPTPRELLTMVLGQGGAAAGVEHAVVLGLFDR
ncbi:MAG TPA: PIG-L deacetylase family protein [Intrasporangium sp.]|nr:PIG-L deacetylase family protein [Intrasporangium sp.]